MFSFLTINVYKTSQYSQLDERYDYLIDIASYWINVE